MAHIRSLEENSDWWISSVSFDSIYLAELRHVSLDRWQPVLCCQTFLQAVSASASTAPSHGTAIANTTVNRLFNNHVAQAQLQAQAVSSLAYVKLVG